MKKVGVLFLALVFGMLFLQVVYATEHLDSLEEGLDEQIEELEAAEDRIDGLREGKWDYLGREWSKILLKNKFVSGFDSFFTKISIVFVIFFGEPYSLSLTLLFIVILWFYFFIKFKEMIGYASLFSPWVSNVMAFGLTLVLAQVTLIRKIVEFFGWLVFSSDTAWIRGLIFTGILIFLIFLARASTLAGKNMKKRREKTEKEMAKIDRSFLHKFADILRGIFSGD